MLAIRMQRVGRKKLAQYRVIVQDSHSQPTSGKIVANLGNYNPHTKVANLKIEEIERYLSNGAQPSERAVRLLIANKVKLPKWVKQQDNKKARKIRNPDKLRKNQPAEETPAEPGTQDIAEVPAPAEEVEAKEDSTSAAEVTEEAPADKPEAAKSEELAK